MYIKTKNIVIAALLVTGCASSTPVRVTSVEKQATIADNSTAAGKAAEAAKAAEVAKAASNSRNAAIEKKIAEIDVFKLKEPGLTRVNAAFAKEMERLNREYLSLRQVKMSTDQKRIAQALFDKAENLEPVSLIQSRIDKLEALPASEMSISNKRELEGLTAKIRGRLGYKHILNEGWYIPSYSLDKPVEQALCYGLQICDD